MKQSTDLDDTENLKTGRRKRTETFGIKFREGLAAGWCFNVEEAHREALDILYVTRVDRAKSTKQKTVHRKVWARGVPPVLSFSEGSIFYDPPDARLMNWNDALKVLRRSVQILYAFPDQERPQGAGRVDGSVTCIIRKYLHGEVHETDRV
mgnify:FL=1